MKKAGGAFRITLALLMAFSLLLTGKGWAATAPIEALAMGTNTFTLTLYRQLLAQEKGNIFFSPISISLALAMAYGGARGETATEMARVLGYNLPSDQLHPALADLSRKLAVAGNKDGQALSVANAAWIKTGLRLLPPYLKVIRNYYGNEIQQLDFCKEDQARKTINAWVAQKTHNRISDLIPPRAVDCDTRLVLTNAIYFLGEWAEKFAKDQTKPELFWLAPDKNVEAPFIDKEGKFICTVGCPAIFDYT